MEQARNNWVAKARTLPRRVLTGAIARAKKRYEQLKKRYGPRYTKVMLVVVFLALFSPMPGSTVVGVGLIVVIAETHRAVSKRGDFAEAIADLVLVVKTNLPWWATGRWPSPRR